MADNEEKKSMNAMEPSADEVKANYLEQFVRKLPSARPVVDLYGFNETGRTYYCCKVHIIVCAFLTMPATILPAVIIFALAMDYKSKELPKSDVITAFLTIEFTCCLILIIMCILNFVTINRRLSSFFATSQVITTLGTLGVGIIIAVNLSDGYRIKSQQSTNNSVTSVSQGDDGQDELLVLVIFTFLLFIVQAITSIIIVRFRLYLVVKLAAIKANVKTVADEPLPRSGKS